MIATSGPSINYPKRAYRNPLDALVNFLDSKHGQNWCIWEFRAEGTGYPDSAVSHRIHHYPWPDHHPPPFALIPAIMGSMRNWLKQLDNEEEKKEDENNAEGQKPERVAVVHCKAGKGRSGTVACAYMICEQGWKAEDALARFTERRMRVGFGAGVSIPSQLRYVGYIDRWVNSMSKKYVERPVEIMEIHVWGLKDGVKVAVEGYIEEGKQIKCFHLFHGHEKTVVDDGKAPYSKKNDTSQEPGTSSGSLTSSSAPESSAAATNTGSGTSAPSKHSKAVIFRPSEPIILPSSDVNIDFERRSKAAYKDWAMVTSIAHVWFNAYFEGGDKQDSNVFEAEWDALDGIKGTTKKGVRALDRVKVVWRYPTPSEIRITKDEPVVKDENEVISPSAALGQTIDVPKPGEPVPETTPPDWHLRNQGEKDKENLSPREQTAAAVSSPTHQKEEPVPKGFSEHQDSWVSAGTAAAAAVVSSATHSLEKGLGIRKQADESRDVSLANSEDGSSTKGEKDPGLKPPQKTSTEIESPMEGVQSFFGPDGSSKK